MEHCQSSEHGREEAHIVRTPSAMSSEGLGEHETAERTPEQRSKLRKHLAPAWRWSVLHVFNAHVAAVFNAPAAGEHEYIMSL